LQRELLHDLGQPFLGQALGLETLLERTGGGLRGLARDLAQLGRIDAFWGWTQGHGAQGRGLTGPTATPGQLNAQGVSNVGRSGAALEHGEGLLR
jgi:hypothetical protein